MKRLARYLQGKLGVDEGTANIVSRFVVKAERNYLMWIYGYDKLARLGIDELDLLERLKRPFVFGFLVKEILDSDLSDEVKERAALESIESINTDAEFEWVPAYLFKAINFLLKRRGFERRYFEILVRFGLALSYGVFYPHVSVMSDEMGDVKEVFNFMLGADGLSPEEKIAFLTAVLTHSHINENLKLKLYDEFLRSDRVPMDLKKELCASAADDRYMEYAGEKTKPFLTGKDLPLDIPPIQLLFVPPSIVRRSIRWLAGAGEDKRALIEKYFKEKITDIYPYQTLGALDVCRAYHEELG